jgi:tetratricopeptide (TPR) repeat protein
VAGAISALCIAGLSQIAGSMTAAGIAGGAIGVGMNVIAARADAMLCAVTNATVRQFTGKIRDPANHDLLKGMIAAHIKAFRYYAETLNGQATATDRPIADKVISLSKKDIHFDIPPAQTLLESVNTLIAGSGDVTLNTRRQSFIAAAVHSLVAWIESEIDETIPPQFQSLLTQPAPNGRESWEAKFQLHLAETIKADDRYSKIFIASNIAELVGRTITTQELSSQMLSELGALQDQVDRIGNDVRRILELANAGALGPQMRASKIEQRAFVMLARQINLAVDDDEQALAELSDAIERLLALERSAESATNFHAVTDQAIKLMTEKAMKGNFDDAATTGARAFADWEQLHEAQRQSGIALAQATIEQHRLRNDMRAVSEWTIRRIGLEASQESEKFELLCKETKACIDRGVEKGINFDLGLASSLALKAIERASNDDERGKARLLYGNGVCQLGERSGNAAPLEAALSMYAKALDDLPRDRVPLKWAECQNDTGQALSALGTVERKIELLYEAEECFRRSLSESTFDRDPSVWVSATVNLGNVLGKLGRLEKDISKLESAAIACRSVLENITPQFDQFNWFGVHNNLAIILSAIGEIMKSSDHLIESMATFDKIITQLTYDKAPLVYLGAMANRAAAMVNLAELTGDSETLSAAEVVLNRVGELASGKESGMIKMCYVNLDRAAEVRARWQTTHH